MLAPLAPWAARNWVTLHKVQFLTARYIQMPGSYIPVGFYAWTKTWLVSYSDVENVLNRYEQEPLYIEYFPPSAFDSAEERARVETLLEDQHNDSFVFSPPADAQFAELARERTARRPFRTYLTVPFRRALTLWFTPRTELLFYEGNWWPPIRHWADYDTDFAVGLLYTALNYFYVGLALAGALMMRKQQGVALWRFLSSRARPFWPLSTSPSSRDSSFRASPRLWRSGRWCGCGVFVKKRPSCDLLYRQTVASSAWKRCIENQEILEQ
jgi:hypothetical protein